jgi:lipoprotein-releasing system ATP-binding protein
MPSAFILSSMPLIELRNVSKSYRDPGSGEEVPVLRGVSLAIEPGQSVAIVGPSGCGKSTLLNILGTLDEPDQGEVIFEGESIRGASPARISALRSEKIGFVFQLHHLLPQCTVLENVLLPTLALAVRPDSNGTTARGMELLKTVGLEHRASYKPAQLSGGERQRVAVVRALINQPRLLLADEPTGSLDEVNAAKLTELMVNLVDKFGISLVLVTHQKSQAEKMGTLLHLHDGKPA